VIRDELADTIEAQELKVWFAATNRALEAVGLAFEAATLAGVAVADLDDDEVSVALVKAQQWLTAAGNRVAQMNRRPL